MSYNARPWWTRSSRRRSCWAFLTSPRMARDGLVVTHCAPLELKAAEGDHELVAKYRTWPEQKRTADEIMPMFVMCRMM